MKVWYVSYGSNVNYDRFLCYISGGKTEFMSKPEIGCTNKKKPNEFGLVELARELKFIESSDRWSGGGVAVVSTKENANYKTYCVRYLVDVDQFIEIIKQENKISLYDDINITIDDLLNGTTKDMFPNKRYSQLLYLGKYDGYNAYTFTCNIDRFNSAATKPSEEYLKSILLGLLSYTSNTFNNEVILSSFMKYDGIAQNFTYDDLKKMLYK